MSHAACSKPADSDPHYTLDCEEPDYPRIKMIYFSAILDDVNANGGTGSGFTPIPA